MRQESHANRTPEIPSKNLGKPGTAVIDQIKRNKT